MSHAHGVIPADWTEFTTPDGLLTLRLPADWSHEDEEDDGTSAFGPEDEEEGVLRVSAMVFTKKPDEKNSEISAKELPRLIVKRGPQPERVAEGRYLIHRVEEDEEEGEPLVQHIWEMVHQTGPREAVILYATYTLGTKETLKGSAKLVEGLDAALRACRFDTSEEEEEEFEFEDELEDEDEEES